MTKVAIYGFVRIAFDLLGPPAWWWALPPIVLGAVTAVLGLLYAVLDCDLKRVLAYSTIENVGVIFVALGLALAFRANGQDAAAAVAMAAALLHALNHSWFKSLLFLGAGAVLHATGRRDLEGLGGLIHRMPRTAVFFLVGALAISALPPLNGFVSEWLLFQAVIAAPALPQSALRFASPAIGAMLALAAALAAAWSGMGLRISRSVSGHPVHRVEFRPAIAPRLRCRCLRRPGNRRDTVTRRYPAGALFGRRRRLHMERALRLAGAGHTQAVGAPQRVPIPDDPALPGADVHGAGHSAVDRGGDDMIGDLV